MGWIFQAICNLGVWCISVQQLGDVVVGPRIDLLLRAVVHALDNPFGSLSTTFEAMQVIFSLCFVFLYSFWLIVDCFVIGKDFTVQN